MPFGGSAGSNPFDAVAAGTGKLIVGALDRLYGVLYTVSGAGAGTITITNLNAGGKNIFIVSGLAASSSGYFLVPGAIARQGLYVQFTNMTSLIVYRG